MLLILNSAAILSFSFLSTLRIRDFFTGDSSDAGDAERFDCEVDDEATGRVFDKGAFSFPLPFDFLTDCVLDGLALPLPLIQAIIKA